MFADLAALACSATPAAFGRDGQLEIEDFAGRAASDLVERVRLRRSDTLPA